MLPPPSLGNNAASPARPMQGAVFVFKGQPRILNALALRVAPQAWHRSFARVASGRAATVSCKSMHHSLPHSLPLRSLLPRSLRSLRSSGSLRFRSFRRSFPAPIHSPPAASCLSATCRWPAALIFDLASASRQPSLRSDEADRLRPDNQGRPRVAARRPSAFPGQHGRPRGGGGGRPSRPVVVPPSSPPGLPPIQCLTLLTVAAQLSISAISCRAAAAADHDPAPITPLVPQPGARKNDPTIPGSKFKDFPCTWSSTILR